MSSGVLFAGLYGALSLLRFNRLEVSSWDNAIFEQAIKAYAQLDAPIVPIKGPGFNILGDHFSPITALVAPFYRMFPSAQTVLLAQVVLIALSVAIVMRAAMKHAGRWPGLAIGVAYGLSFGIQSAVVADFHEVAFAVPLLALAGTAYLDRRWNAVLWWSLPLLLVKEDLALTVAAVGVVLIVCGQRRRGIVLAATGVLAMLFIVFVLIAQFNPDGGYAYTSKLGAEGGVVGTLFAGGWQKATTMLITFGVTGFLALRSPWVLLTIPTFGWRFLAGKEYYWGTDWHYSLILMPIVFIAMVDAITRMREGDSSWRRLVGPCGATVALLVALAMQFNSPLSALTKSQTYAEAPRADAARHAIALIPAGASVTSDIGLITHLVTDHTAYWVGSAYWVGTADGIAADYVLFDTRSGWSAPPDVVAYAERHTKASYELIYSKDGYALARRVG